MFARHQMCGDALQAGLVERGFRLFAAEGNRLPQLTSVWVPDEKLPDRNERGRCPPVVAVRLRHRDRWRPRRPRREGLADRPDGSHRPPCATSRCSSPPSTTSSCSWTGIPRSTVGPGVPGHARFPRGGSVELGTVSGPGATFAARGDVVGLCPLGCTSWDLLQYRAGVKGATGTKSRSQRRSEIGAPRRPTFAGVSRRVS